MQNQNETLIRRAYSQHCIRAHLGGFEPMTLAAFCALIWSLETRRQHELKKAA